MIPRPNCITDTHIVHYHAFRCNVTNSISPFKITPANNFTFIYLSQSHFLIYFRIAQFIENWNFRPVFIVHRVPFPCANWLPSKKILVIHSFSVIKTSATACVSGIYFNTIYEANSFICNTDIESWNNKTNQYWPRK